MDINEFLASENTDINLSNYYTDYPEKPYSKKKALKVIKENVKKMSALQDKLYAYNKYGILIIFQAMDAAGKDSAIKHVMSGVNPQGTQVFSFKQPSSEELDHDYMWRTTKALPERGRIGIFNRSYYEEVLVVKVHNLIEKQQLPDELKFPDIWQRRYRQIRDFERYLSENGIVVVKFFLHLSKEEQKRRFMRRLERPDKNWKFSAADLKERKYWDQYQEAYEKAISETSKSYAPWYIVPADTKWFTRMIISDVIIRTLENLKMEYPTLTEEQKEDIRKYKDSLEKESI
jgi:PPK2 family polyphosphate:nucleotide phosphotransferase